MPQRVIFVVVHGEPSDFTAQWQQLSVHSLSGTVLAGASARGRLFSAEWIQAVAAARLSRVTVGTDWRDAAPVRSRALAVFTENGKWRCLQPSSEARVAATLAALPTPLSVAQKLSAEEPWDLLGISLPLPADAEMFAKDLATFLAAQPTDVGTVITLCGMSDAKWLCHTQGLKSGDGGERPIEDVLATVLAWLNVEAPATLKGARLESTVDRASGYSVEDEKEIQKRLEDLGYL